MSFSRDIDEARNASGMKLHIEADFGGVPLVEYPVERICCSQSKIEELVRELTAHLPWEGEAYWFSPGDSLREDIILDSDVSNLGISRAIEEYLQGKTVELLEGTLEVNHRSEPDLKTSLHHAVRRGWVDLIAALIRAGADVEAKERWGRTPMHQLCFESWPHENRWMITDILVDAGCNLNAIDSDGCSPLFVALRGDLDRQFILYLKSKGAKAIPFSEPPINLPDRIEGRANSDGTLIDTLCFSFDLIGRHRIDTWKLLLQDPRNGDFWMLDIEDFPEEESVFVATRIDPIQAKSEFGPPERRNIEQIAAENLP